MIVGLALSGGASRRMGGGDKALLEIGRRPMLSYVLERLRGETVAVAISANSEPARFTVFECPVLPDGEFAGRGPLAGVLAGLQWAASLGAATLLSIPGDTPFVPAGLAAALAPAPACAAAGGLVHHLVALWPAAARGCLREFLRGPGPYSVRGFAKVIGMRTVVFEDAADLFRNINTPDQLAAAEAGVAGFARR